jgi:hypothetical protein
MQKREKDFDLLLTDKAEALQTIADTRSTYYNFHAAKVNELGFNPEQVKTTDDLISYLLNRGYYDGEILTALGITLNNPYLSMWQSHVQHLRGDIKPNTTRGTPIKPTVTEVQ